MSRWYSLVLFFAIFQFPHKIFSTGKVLCGQSDYSHFHEQIDTGEKKFFINRRFRATFLEASINCTYSGLELATFESELEYKIVTNYIRTLKAIPNELHQNYWLSAVRKNRRSREFIWRQTGKPVTLDKWAPHEPNNMSGNENCMELWSNFKLNDDPCNKRIYFICQCYATRT